MAATIIHCPGCRGAQVQKYGKSRNGEQRYICNTPDCITQTFRLEYRYEGAKAGIKEKIIAMAANASGIRDTARMLGKSRTL